VRSGGAGRGDRGAAGAGGEAGAGGASSRRASRTGPMVMIDQVCWNEMNLGDELTVRSTDPECRHYEWSLRATLYQWETLPRGYGGRALHRAGQGHPQHRVRGPGPGTSRGCPIPRAAWWSQVLQPVRNRRRTCRRSRCRRSAMTRRRPRGALAVAHELFDGAPGMCGRGARTPATCPCGTRSVPGWAWRTPATR